MYCSNCGEQIDDAADICIHCGVRVGKVNNYCHHCGGQLSGQAEYCMNCGHKVMMSRKSEEIVVRKEKAIALLLAFFIGMVGGHDFYLGYKKNGIIKIILTVTGVGTIVSEIWALVDFIQIATGKKTDADGDELI